jgi:hypothetical protein
MPETDILNPDRNGKWNAKIKDSMNPNYGFTRKRPATRLMKKAIGGTPYSRETANTGHQFSLTWIARSWLCVQRLKRYYEQYEDGFFTIIDWDGGGRHYVGRFTTEIVPTETANGKWDVQNVAFEEVPIVPMLQYPNDWDGDSIRLGVCNDFTDQKLSPTTGVWMLRPQVTQTEWGPRTSYTLDSNGVAGDSATYEYRGYGFRLWLQTGPNIGIVNVLLDGVQIATNLDLYSAAAASPQLVLTQESVSLDFHRVQVVATGNKNPASTAPVVSWAFLDVMR